MKVALFTETYIPNVNGVVAHVKTLKEGLEKLGHEVLVVTADKHARHHYIEDGVLHCPAAEIKRFYGFGMAAPISQKRLRMIKSFKPDVIHIHHEFGIGLSGIMASKLQKKPLVYTLHTMYDQYIYYVAPRPFLTTATKFSHQYMRFIARNATALTGPSQKCDEYFKRIGIQKDLNLIPNSADVEIFNRDMLSPGDIDDVYTKHNLDRERSYVCFVGRLGKEKDIDTLLDYWAKTINAQDGLHLLVIGDGPEAQNLAEQAKTLGIADMVTFTGAVPHTKMPLYFAICDAFVTASLSEMNSISMLEGMAMGCPTLQRFDKLNADQIESGVNGHLYETAEELAHHLRDIRAFSPEQKLEIKRRVRETVIKRGSSDLAAYMVTVYEKAISEKSVVAPSGRYKITVPLRKRKSDLRTKNKREDD